MIKRIILPVLLLIFTNSCAELQQVLENMPVGTDQQMIGAGLKEALDNGIDKQVTKLMGKDGFYTNELTKILLPAELQKVDKTLRDIGLGSLADEGIKAINRAASQAVKEAKPIFVNAVKGITFADAANILMGDKDAATNYLKQRTQQELYNKFNPVIKESFAKVGADDIWSNIINHYNSIPLVNKINPDLTDYVTGEALKGVFTMIAVEENNIRTNVSHRSSDLLRRVFAMQDNK